MLDGATNTGCRVCDTHLPSSTSNCACQADSSSSASNGWSGSSAWSGTGYFPSYPASSPYVTAVGATMGAGNIVPNSGEGERACQV